MAAYSIIVTEAARDDLSGIADYIAIELQEPVTALGQIRRIRAEVLKLEVMPERYALVEEEYLAERGIWNFVVDNYLVFYTVEKSAQTVTIIRVLYGRRDWNNIIGR